MKKFDLIKSFLGKTTVYPSGVHKQNAVPFQTQNLEQIIKDKSVDCVDSAVVKNTCDVRRD